MVKVAVKRKVFATLVIDCTCRKFHHASAAVQMSIGRWQPDFIAIFYSHQKIAIVQQSVGWGLKSPQRGPLSRKMAIWFYGNILLSLENCKCSTVCWVRVEKPSAWATGFQVFSTIQGKTMAKRFLSLLLRYYRKTIITPMRQARTYGRVWAPGPTPSAPKQWKSAVHFKC